jgi:acetoin utilization protein AcuB
MKIDRCMKHPVVTVKPRDSIRHARETMAQHRINQLPVVVDGNVIGIITDRDLRDAFPSVFEAFPGATNADTDPATIPVEDVMTANVLTLGPGARVEDAARLMRTERIGAIPVVAGERLVGILTRSDVLEAFLALAESASPGSGRPV